MNAELHHDGHGQLSNSPIFKDNTACLAAHFHLNKDVYRDEMNGPVFFCYICIFSAILLS